MNLNPRHKKQVQEMIGKKVRIYISGKRIERVLKSDVDGLFINYKNERVPVKPDMSTLNILSFIALAQKYAAAIKRLRAETAFRKVV